MRHYRKNLAVLALLIAFTTVVTAVEVNTTSGLENGSFQGTHLQDVEVRLGPGENDDALVGYWNFESKVPNKVVDASRNGNNGTLYGEELDGTLNNFDFDADSGWVEGKRGPHALQFDGSNDWVDIPHRDFGDTSAITFWIKPEDLSSSRQVIIRDFCGHSNGNEDCGYGKNTISLWGDEIVVRESGETNNNEKLYTGIKPSKQKWTHVAIADTGNTLKAYADGELSNSKSMDNIHGVDAIADTAGDSGNVYFDGKLDNIRVYDSSLAASEISAIYENKEDPRKGLVGEWTFDSGSGTTAYDTSKWQQGVRQGKSMEFDGSDDWINMSEKLIPTKSSVTISAWMKEDDKSGRGGVFQREESGTGNGFHFGRGAPDKHTFYVGDTDGDKLSVDALNDPTDIWVHWVGVYDRSQKKIWYYKNGEMVGKDTNSAFDPNKLGKATQNNLRIARRETNTWDGEMDNIRIYSRAITSSEVKELYNPSPGYLTSGFVDAGSTTDWKELNWTESLAQNTEVEGRVQTASEVSRTDNYSEWSKGTSSFSGPTEGLVGYWRFEENVSGNGGTVKDWSGNQNHGTTKNGIDTTSEGFRAQSNAYNFDRHDYIKISDDSSLDIQDKFTISAWVYPVEAGSSSHSVLLKSSYSDTYGMVIRSSAIRAYLENNNYRDFQSGDLQNSWNHISVTYSKSSGKVKGYLNGRLLGSKSYSSSLDTNNDPIWIGWDSRKADWQEYAGKIDELRLYNQALSSSEIKSLYTSGSYTSDWIKADNINWAQWKQTRKGSDLEPLAQWRFDEGQGQWANDSSGDNNGKLGGSLSSESSDPSWKSDCRFRGCLSFDGTDDFVDADISSFPDPMNEVTVSFWSKNNGNGSDSVLNAAPDSTSNRFNIHLPWENNDALYWDFGDTSGGGRLSHPWQDSEWENEWNHWTFVSDSNSGQKIYVNGELLTSDSDADSFSRGSKSLNIMRYSGGPNYMQGDLDDLRIYNRSLSNSSVKALYNSPSQSFSSSSFQVRSRASDPVKSSLVGSWSFEGVGQTVADSSGEGNLGTLGTTAGDESSDPQRVSGVSGRGVKFDGSDDYIPGGNVYMKNMAASAWIKTTDSEDKAGVISVNNIGDGDNRHISMVLRSDGKIDVRANGGGGSIATYDGSITVNDGKWHHVALSRSDRSSEDFLKTYIDGNLDVDSVTSNSFPSDDNEKFRVAANRDKTDYINATIDEVKVFDETLSNSEIKNMYHISDYTSASEDGSGQDISVSSLNVDGQSFDSKYYQFKLNSLTGTSKSVPSVESVSLANTSGWSSWSSSPSSSLDIGSSSLVQAQFNLSSSEPESSPELSAFSVLEGLGICDRRGPLNECIADKVHDLASEIIDITSIFESKDTAEFTSTGTATLNISNSSILSGSWVGSFNISTSRGKDARIKPGAEFKPESGRIVIGE